MSMDPWVLATIAAMAVATYATRAGGYLVFRAFPTPAWLRDALAYVPGALFVSYCGACARCGRGAAMGGRGGDPGDDGRDPAAVTGHPGW